MVVLPRGQGIENGHRIRRVVLGESSTSPRMLVRFTLVSVGVTCASVMRASTMICAAYATPAR